MNKILYILFFSFISVFCSAQVTQYLGAPGTIIQVRGTLKGGDSTFILPFDTLASAPNGSMAIKSGTIYYKKSGNWIYITVDTVHMSAQIDTIRSSVSPVILSGAKADGTTDDATVLNTALNIGGNISFPHGKTFFIASPLVITKSNTHIDLNGSTIKIDPSADFSTGIIHTNTSMLYQDNSPSISMVGHSSYFIYTGVSNLSPGQMLLISGPQYDFISPGGGYNYGYLGQIKRINGDSVYLSNPIDTSFGATKLQAFSSYNNISFSNGIIDGNNNATAQAIGVSTCTNVYVGGITYKGKGTFLGVGIGYSINGLIENCVIDSVDGIPNGTYGIQVNGHSINVIHNIVKNVRVHCISAGNKLFLSSDINYISNTCVADNQQTNIGAAPMDMHSNIVSGNMVGNTLVSYKVTGMQLRSGGVNIINNDITVVNANNASTVKAITFGENFTGKSEIANNRIHFVGGPLLSRHAISFESGIIPAVGIYFHDNYCYNGSDVGNTQPITNSRFINNHLYADTLSFGSYTFNNISNSIISGGEVEDRTTSGFSYGLALSDTTYANVDVSNITFYSREKGASVVRITSGSTGFTAHDLVILGSNTSSPFLDQTTGLQTPQWNNKNIDSFGVITALNYATLPTPSAAYEGKYIMVVQDTTTVPYIGQKLNTGLYGFIKIVGGLPTWTRSNNYISPINLTDSIAIGHRTPTVPFSVLGESRFTVVKNDTLPSNLSGIGVTLRQGGTNGTNVSMNGVLIGYTVNVGDTVNAIRGIYFNYGNPAGKVPSLYGMFLQGGAFPNVSNYTAFTLGDVSTDGVGLVKGVELGITKGANKYSYTGGTAVSNFQGSIQIGPGSPSDSTNMLRVKGQSQLDSLVTIKNLKSAASTDSLLTDSAGVIRHTTNKNISGTYVPTLTNTTNITSSTLLNAYYIKMGNIVHVMINGTITPTIGSTNTVLTVSLPFTTASTTQNYIGQGTVNVNATTYTTGLVSVNSGTTATFSFIPGASVGTGGFSLNFDIIL